MKHKIKVPTHLGEITLKQYQKMASRGENISNEDLVSIFCNISSDEVLRLPNGGDNIWGEQRHDYLPWRLEHNAFSNECII